MKDINGVRMGYVYMITAVVYVAFVSLIPPEKIPMIIPIIFSLVAILPLGYLVYYDYKAGEFGVKIRNKD